jgi:hypothetical protein
MKRIKEILEFLKSLLDFLASLKVWLPAIITVILSIVGYLSGIANINVKFNMPLLLVITIIILSLYPILKFLEYLLKPRKLFPYNGLLWKAAKISFINPVPLCPKDNCGCQIVFKAQPPPPIQLIGVGNNNRIETDYKYVYECPIHGPINVPNIHISELVEKARLAQFKLSSK